MERIFERSSSLLKTQVLLKRKIEIWSYFKLCLKIYDQVLIFKKSSSGSRWRCKRIQNSFHRRPESTAIYRITFSEKKTKNTYSLGE